MPSECERPTPSTCASGSSPPARSLRGGRGPERAPFDYAVVRVVPRVEREEFLNVGVIVFCRGRRYLGARIEVDTTRLAALAPWLDPAEVAAHLEQIPRVCAGGDDAGPIGLLPQRARF